MFKKVISSVLMLIMLLSLGVGAADNMLLIAPQGDVMPIGDDLPEPTPVFSDVANDAAYKPSIDILVKNGVLSGYPDGTFRPETPITRAEMCKIINLAFGYTDTTDAAGFPDLEEGAWYVPYVLAAQKAGYVLGDPNGNFRPSSNITREEVCTILYRIIKPFDLPITVNITDNVSEWAKTYVEAIVKNSIMPLEDGGKFRSTEMIKRFELAVAVAPYSIDIEKISCVVTFGDGADMFTQSVVIGAQMPTLPAPKVIPAGMKFVGWSLSPDEPVLIDSKYVFMGPTKLYPVFENAVYTVQFIVDGTILSTQKIAHGEKLQSPHDPLMAGYVFSGWAINGTDDIVDIDTYEVTSNIVFNAIFKSSTNSGNLSTGAVTYNVKFISNGKTYDTQKIEKNGYADTPEDPTLAGHIFLYWSLTTDGDEVVVGSYPIKSATTFFAVFEEKTEIKKYTVSFMVGSEITNTQMVVEDDVAQAPAKPSKKDHVFKGWSREEDGSIVNVNSYAIYDDTIFYAVFEKASEIKKFTVEFIADGEVVKTQTVVDGNEASAPNDPELDGFEFLHWSLEEDGDAVDVDSYIITDDTVFYAVFEEITTVLYFDVTFMNGEDIHDIQEGIKGGTNALNPEPPEKTGYNFLYWSLEEDGTEVDIESYKITEETTFYAVFELKDNPNDPTVITALEKAIKDFTNVTFRTSEEKAIKAAILDVMGLVYTDATEFLMVIDTEYIQMTYSDDLEYIRGLVSKLDDDKLSQFITRITNNIDEDSFDILADYFLTEEQKDQLSNKTN